MIYNLRSYILLVIVLFPELLRSQDSLLKTEPISYSLDTASVTSAGIYKNDGTLVRTLWSNVSKNRGLHTFKWDGLDDYGKPVQLDNYTAKVLSNNLIYQWEGVIGNNSLQQTGPAKWTDFEGIAGMVIVGNYAYVCHNYNEGKPAQSKFLLSKPGEKIRILNGANGSNNLKNGQNTPFVCSDGINVYWAGDDPWEYIKSRHFVFASKVSTDRETIFSAGKPLVTYGHGNYQSVICYRDVPEAHISGIAVQKRGIYLFVSRINMDLIDVYNKTTGAFVRSVQSFAPGFLTVDDGDNLWVEHVNSERPAEVKLSGSPYGSKPYQNDPKFNWFKVFDGNTGSFYSTDTPGGGYVGLDFGDKKKVVTKVRIFPRAGYANRTEGYIEITDNPLGLATPLKQTTAISDGKWTEITWANSEWRRYARLKVSSTYLNVAEMEFWGYEVPSNPVVEKFKVSADGTIASTGTIIKDVDIVAGMTVSPDGFVIAIADRKAEQVKFFSTATGSLTGTLGKQGGYASSPEVADNKFDFYYFNALAYQPDGKLWVGNYGLCRLQKWNPLLSTVEAKLEFLPHNRIAYPDVNNPARVFSGYFEYEVNYDKPLVPGNSNNAWSLTRKWGYGINSDDESRILMRPVTLSNGRTYAMQGDVETFVWEIVELADTGLRFTGSKFHYEWVLMPDGAIRTHSGYNPEKPATWTERRLVRFTAEGNPIWGAENIIATSPIVTNNDPVTRRVSPEIPWVETKSDLMISWEGGAPPPHGSGKWHLGAVNKQTKKWLWKTAANSYPAYGDPFPTDGSYEVNNYVVYCGGPAIVRDEHIFWCYRGEFYKGNGQANKWQHVYENGLMLGQFGALWTQQMGELYAQAGNAGNVISAEVIKVGDNYFLYHCDENGHGGIHRWRIGGLNTIREQKIPVVTNNAEPRLRLQSLRGYQHESVNEVEWVVQNQTGDELFELQKSIDGQLFNKKYTTKASHELSTTYRWVDVAPTEGNNYYRLKISDQSGSEELTEAINVVFTKKVASINVFPNPSVSNAFAVQLNNIVQGSYDLLICSSTGQLIFSGQIKHAGLSSSQTSINPGKLPQGIYHVYLQGNGQRHHTKLVK